TATWSKPATLMVGRAQTRRYDHSASMGGVMDASTKPNTHRTVASNDVPPLTTGQQVSYGFGSIAFGIGGVPLSSALLMLYFNQVIGLEAVFVGTAIMVSVVVDAFTDPL